METKEKILSILLREGKKTATELAEQLNKTRPGIWKSLSGLEEQNFIVFEVANSKKTSIKIAKLDYKNILTKKNLSLILTKQALENQRWIDCFSKIQDKIDFAVLFGSVLNDSSKAKDIDLILVSDKKNFKNVQDLINEIQKTQSKEIHAILLTKQEFQNELKNKNKAYLDAIRKGVVLFGQEKFIDNLGKLYGN